MNQLAFVENQETASLADAVITQLGGWERFTSQAQHISENGAQDGFAGFTYYHETVKMALAHFDAIMENLTNDALEYGQDSVAEMMTSWICLEGYDAEEIDAVLDDHINDTIENHCSIINALAWYALEKYAHAYLNLLEQD